jgi:predicted dithiol-disulfide oxidoreductase (DUF899 family)
VRRSEMSTKERVNWAREISKVEKEAVKAKEKLARLRRRLPAQEIEDYTLTEAGGKPVALSSVFGEKEDLILSHNMGKKCPYCTMWADGFNGVLKHLEDRTAFVVVSPDLPEEQETFARSRGWAFRMLSASGTSFTKDLGFESKDGHPMPGVSAFHRRKDGAIVRVSKARSGPGDDFCSVWHLFDLLKTGGAGWEPKFKY